LPPPAHTQRHRSVAAAAAVPEGPRDKSRCQANGPRSSSISSLNPQQPLLAHDKVRHVGEAIAIHCCGEPRVTWLSRSSGCGSRFAAVSRPRMLGADRSARSPLGDRCAAPISSAIDRSRLIISWRLVELPCRANRAGQAVAAADRVREGPHYPVSGRASRWPAQLDCAISGHSVTALEISFWRFAQLPVRGVTFKGT
jgi:hypothetical protein